MMYRNGRRRRPRQNPFLPTEDGSPAYYSSGGVYTPGISYRTLRRDGSAGDFVEWSPDALPWFPAEGIPSPAQRMLEPAFRAWFKGSKVVDEQGLPLVVWHSNSAWSNASDVVKERFNAFDFSKQVDLGMHFGTQSAARTVGGLCRPFYLSIENPLQSSDMEAWVHGYPFSTQLPEDMLSRKKISFALYSDYKGRFEAFREEFRAEHGDALAARPVPLDLDNDWRYHVSMLLRKLLLDAGYDGVVYENDFEDAGSISWIALHPGQIKSVENTGTWDFNDPDVRRNPRQFIGTYPCVVCRKKVRVYDWLPSAVFCRTHQREDEPESETTPLTEREMADLKKANVFWQDVEVENGEEALPASLRGAEWPAGPEDVELAREVLRFFYKSAPGDY